MRRTGLLITAVLLGFVVIVSRLYTVQVEEHEFWSREARNLVRAATFVPHKRGSLLDRHGRELVRDEELYQVEFTWRDFRRGHPLGQLVQARSLLELRPVSLAAAWDRLEEWSLEVVQLAPADIEDFGRGAGLSLPDLDIPATEDPQEEQRWTRRGHLHFYLKALLDVSRTEAKQLASERSGPQGRLPYVARVAALRGMSTDALREEIAAELATRRTELARLGALLEEGRDPSDELADLGKTPLERLVARLERIRRKVEDDAADDLFAKAYGFGAWRLDPQNLARLELDWLSRSLFWDTGRLDDWIQSRGRSWGESLQRLFAGPAIARFKLDLGRRSAPQRVLDALADVFADPGARRGGDRWIPTVWRDLGTPAVLAQVERLSGGTRADGRVPALPVSYPELLREELPPEEELVRALMIGVRERGPVDVAPVERELEARELAALLEAMTDSNSPTFGPDDLQVVAEVLQQWNALFQAKVAALWDRLADRRGRVCLQEEWVASALEERAYVVRDRGMRPSRLSSDPSEDLIQIITRYPREYAGFGVRATTRRIPVTLETDGPWPLAHLLLGQVRSPYMTTLLRQRSLMWELKGLQQKRIQTAADEPRIRDIVREVYLPGEFQGGSGIEAYFDDLLRGQNGYRETRGLQDKRDGGREPLNVAPKNGFDLRLTLDTELQRAAQWTLDHPEPLPASETKPDRVWWAYPVGALALISIDGDVLAAASTPQVPGEIGPHQDGQRAIVRERAMNMPLFQPPGSVFKPFVAAWALEYHGLDPYGDIVPCDGSREPARYGKVRCWKSIGHGRDIALQSALEGSCNCYFAWLGESLSDRALREMARHFGFGQPTGVRVYGPDSARLGLNEHHLMSSGRGGLGGAAALSDVDRQRAGNGLSVLSATPLQVARAYAGLATGVLPELRILDTVLGDGQVILQTPRSGQPLPLSEHHLALVRQSLVEVVRRGTAKNRGLDRDSLGFQVAAKTGSADYIAAGMVPVDPDAPLAEYEFQPGVRKHAWFAGWFPAEAPRAALVVYLHDTSTTSSRSAVYLARQFLASEAVQDWVREGEQLR